MAYLKKLKFNKDNIRSVTVELTVQEAIYLALLAGKQTGAAADAILPNHGADANAEVYEVLTGLVFNRYFDDGVKEAARNLA